MSSLIKTGLFGGTFNPIHNAHLRVAERAYSQFQLDRVIFIPSKIPPHKQNSEIPSAEDRYQMVKLAINSHDNLDISRVEINRPGPSYTVDTLEHMRKSYSRIGFIVGADNLIRIKTWKSPEKLLTMCPFLVAPRHGYGENDFRDGIFEGKDLRFLDMDEISLSSSQIRERYEQGLSVDNLIPPEVKSYIEQSGLYRSASTSV